MRRSVSTTAAYLARLRLAAVLVFFYFVTRQHVLVLASAGGRIALKLSGMSTEAALQFIDRAEAAKHKLWARSYA